MKVVCIQPDVIWQDAPANRQRLERMIRDSQPGAEALVVLPETALSGFTADVEAGSDSPAGESFEWARGLAAELRISLLLGLITTSPEGRGRNEAVLIGPEGEIGRYAKMNPFILGGESRTFEPGRQVEVFTVGGVRVCPLICYDLRFPELFREGAFRGADVFAVIANWPAAREHHWHAMLRSRAIENQAFVVGVNRVGADPNVQYSGGTTIFDADGHPLLSMDELPGVGGATLDLEAQRSYRLKLPYVSDYQRRRRAAERKTRLEAEEVLGV